MLSGTGSWFTWGLVLLIGLPVMVVALGELSRALAGTTHAAFCKPIDLFRGSALLLLFVTVLLRFVVELPDTHLAVMVVDTLSGIAVLNAALALTNAFIFDTGGQGRVGQTPKLLIDLGRLFMVALGGAMIVSYVWKVDLTSLVAALGVGSIVIGLALQDTLSNVFSGVTILSTGPFRIGDWVKVGDTVGQIRSISMRSLSLSLSNGDLLDIPNNAVAKQKLFVLGAARGWNNISVDLKLDQSYAPERIRALLLQAAQSVPNVLATPAPSVQVKGFDGANIDYSITLYVAEFPQRSKAASEFLSFLWYIAAREGVSLRATDDDTPPAMLAAPARNPPDDLEQVGTFQLPRAALEALSADARIERYRDGEILLRRGARPAAVYVLLSGTVQIDADAQVDQPNWTFTRGDIVLFKTFFRGGESPATLRCMSEVEVVRIPMEALTICLAQEAGLAQSLERMLAAREAAGENARADGTASADQDRVGILQALFKV